MQGRARADLLFGVRQEILDGTTRLSTLFAGVDDGSNAAPCDDSVIHVLDHQMQVSVIPKLDRDDFQMAP